MPEDEGNVGEDFGVVGVDPKCPPGKIKARTPVCLSVVRPAVEV
jgi:hypothetical protein